MKKCLPLLCKKKGRSNILKYSLQQVKYKIVNKCKNFNII
uniref:Uncharacterized protein n=1 Tax=Myoviridae sp. ctNQV2 TaxID=2827683 RepID=A0A8S5RZF4_9CAUD|nr:MAG TPA: hypothetical protein [Myoviridae sp. ctNQV2]